MTVKSGMVLAEIETDKATMEVEAVDEGRIEKILIAAGTEGVKVNTPIAIMLAEGEDASSVSAAPSSPPAKSDGATGQAAASAQASRQPSTQPASSDTAKPAPAPAAGRCRNAAQAHRRPAPLPEQRGDMASAFSFHRWRAASRSQAASISAPPGFRPAWAHRQARCRKGSGKRQRPGESRTHRPTASLTVPTTPLVEAMADDKVLALYERDDYEIVPHDGMRKSHRPAPDTVEANHPAFLSDHRMRRSTNCCARAPA